MRRPSRLASRGRFFSEDDDLDYDITQLRPRGRLQPRAAVDRRQGQGLADGAGAGDLVADAADRRLADRPQRLLRRARTADVPAGRRPERGDRQLPDPGAARRRRSGCRWSTADASSRRSSIARRSPSSRRIRSRSSCSPSRATSTAIAATGIRRRRSRDYATARLEITVPPDYDAVASGTPAGPPDARPDRCARAIAPRKRFVFISDRPLRYLACVISRFNVVTTRGARAVVERRSRTRRRRRRGAQGPAAGAARADDVAVADRAGQPAPGLARPRHRRSHRGDLQVLRLAHRRRAVSELHRRVVRERSARRPQPGLLRHPQPAAADARRTSGGTIR